MEIKIKATENFRGGHGHIWIEEGDVKFPEENWYDFIFAVLIDWNAAMIEALEGKKAKNCFNFIDGNLMMILEKVDDSNYSLSLGTRDFFDDLKLDPEEYKLTISKDNLVMELIRVNQELIGLVDKSKGSPNESFFELKKWYEKLLHAVG